MTTEDSGPTEAVADLDGRSISYTYDNGWSFTNTFDHDVRHSSVARGDLSEIVSVTRLREGLYFISWIDDEMGLLAQIIDFKNETVLAAIPVDGEPRTETIVGRITG